jgi:hypothetical protein
MNPFELRKVFKYFYHIGVKQGKWGAFQIAVFNTVPSLQVFNYYYQTEKNDGKLFSYSIIPSLADI